MRYDITRAWFTTPNGRPVIVYVREGTNDWNTAFASLNEDEYGLRGREVRGLAVDIGGYLGTVSIALLVDNPSLRVVCVEPVPENADLIERNAQANDVADRLTLIRGAVGKGEVTVRYAYQGGENELHHAFVGNSTITAPTAEHKTAVYPGLSIADIAGDQDVAFLKIDCEGGEFAFLDDPDVSRLAYIVAEWHNVPFPDGTTGSQDRIRALLEPTHVVSFSGPQDGPGGFTATRR